MKKVLLLTLSIPLLFACGEKEPIKSNSDNIEYNDSSVDETNTTPETVSNIIIKANEDMTFDKTNFTIKAGEEVTLLFLNNGTSPKEAMGHNVVVLNQGTDVNAFAIAAASSKDNDYIPADKASEIIVHTKILGPKENEQVKFKIDQPGVYDFICSFPGHSATMKGKITVVK